MDKRLNILGSTIRIFGDSNKDIKFVDEGYIYNSKVYPISELQNYLTIKIGTKVNLNNVFSFIQSFHWYNKDDCECRDCQKILKRNEV
jgi:hypothetical protein